MKIYSIADITLASGAATAVSATSQKCKWFQVQGVTVASSVRLGDSSVGAHQGALIMGGGVHFAPPIADAVNPYDLADVFVSGTASDVLSVIYAV